MSRKNARQLMEELYGTQRRKGIDKYSKEHPLDVVKFCFIGRDEDCLRAMHLINVAILHDVVEDFGHKGYTLDKVQVVVGLGPAEVRLLDLLTRKPGREEDYLPSLCRDEDAARIKLADRIANCQDLLQWVKDEGGFSEDARRIYEKYKRENAVLLPQLKANFPAQVEDPDHAFHRQIELFQGCMEELDDLYRQYQGQYSLTK